MCASKLAESPGMWNNPFGLIHPASPVRVIAGVPGASLLCRVTGRAFIILLLLLAPCGEARAQASIIGKLQRELAETRPSDADRARKLERLAWYQRDTDPISAMEAAEEAIALAEGIKNPSLVGSAITRRVAAKQTSGIYGGEGKELERAVALLAEHGPEEDLGYALWCLYIDRCEEAGEDSLALVHFERARSIFEKHRSATGLYWVLQATKYGGTVTPEAVQQASDRIAEVITASRDTFLLIQLLLDSANETIVSEEFQRTLRQGSAANVLIHNSGALFHERTACRYMSFAANELADQELALRNALRAHSLSKALRSSSMIVETARELAELYIDFGDRATAMLHVKEALDLLDDVEHEHAKAILLGTYGACLLELNRPDTALRSLQRALELVRGPQSIMMVQGVRVEEAAILLDLGKVYRRLARFDQARARIEEGLAIAQHPGLRIDQAWLRVEHARILAHGSPADRCAALTDLDSVIALATHEGWLEIFRDALFAQHEVHQANGSTQEALRSLKQFITAKDSLLDLERIKDLNALSKRFESERKDAQLHALAQENIVQSDAIAAHRRRNLLLAASLAVVALIGALLFLLLRNARRSRRLLAEKNAAILEAQNKLVESERAREASEVRTRIARDVHDQLGSDLTKLVLLSTEAKELALSEVNAIPALANDIERIAGEANRSLGDIVWSIDPHHDSLAGLTERVRAHCERMLKWSKVDHAIDCVHEGPDRALDPATKRDIYLMLREALNNAIKYAKAQHIHVYFHSSATQIGFEVKDDGVGMVEGNTTGHGLKNMQQRAERIGGVFLTETAEGRGTRIAFHSALANA